MRSNNKPKSLVAACFGMAATFLTIAALSGCGGGAGSGGIDPNSNNNPGGGGNVSDIANATASADGNTFMISSFKNGLGDFSLIENVSTGATPAASANATATVVSAHATEGTQSVDVNFISQAASLIGLKIDNSGLSDWTPYRYASFDVTTGAAAFDGTVVVQSGAWKLTCEGAGAVPANSAGTVTLDMDSCGTNIDKTAVNRLQLRIGATTAAGHFYIDKVRLEKGAPTPIARDIADATTSPDGNTFTITSFKTGLAGFAAVDNAGNTAAAANATAVLDNATHGSEGDNSANLTVTALPAVVPVTNPDPWIGLSSKSNGGLADWTPYRYLKFDVATGTAAFGGMVAIKTGTGTAWDWCGGAWADIPANSSGPVTLDLAAPLGSGCTARDLAHVRELLIFTKSTGTFYIDNVRLEKGTAPTPVSATDSADGTVTTNAGVTTTLLTSFQAGTSAWAVYDNTLAASAALATITTDRPSTYPSEGNTAMKAVVAAGVTVDVAIGAVPSKTDWTGAGTLLVDMAAANGIGWVQLWVKNTAGKQCWDSHVPTAGGNAPAATVTTMSFDLTKLTCDTGVTYNPADVQSYYLLIQGWPGAYYIDNVRLQASAVPPPPASNVLTLADFEAGLGSFVGMDDWGGSARATGSVALDTVAANASQGVQSVSATVSTVTAGAKYGPGLAGNGGVADWSPYRFLKADITTTTGNFNGALAASFGSTYKYCGSSWTWINAGTSSVTLVADLSKCGLTAADLADVKRFQVMSDQVGTFNVDNIRLEKEGTDTADKNVSADGNTYTISSFAGGVGSFSMLENASPNAVPANSGDVGAIADTTAANASQGTRSVDVNYIKLPSSGNKVGFTLDGNGGLANWTGYRYLRFDVTAGASIFEGDAIVFTGSGWNYCGAYGKVEAGHTGTVTLDMNTCATIDKTAVQRLQLQIGAATTAGHFFIDNVRLTKN